MMISTCRRLRWLSACQKYTSSFTSFLRYYILKNPAIWLAGSILVITQEPEFYQIWDWWWNINNNISFQFRLFPRKTNDKMFQKIQKNLFRGHFGPFLPKFGQKWIFQEKWVLSDLRYYNYLPLRQKSEKTNLSFVRKMQNSRMDRWTNTMPERDGQTTVIL